MMKSIVKMSLLVVFVICLFKPLSVHASEIMIDMSNGELTIDKLFYSHANGISGSFFPEDVLCISYLNPDIQGITVADETNVNIKVNNTISHLSIGNSSTVYLSSLDIQPATVYNWNSPSISLGKNSILNISGLVTAGTIYDDDGVFNPTVVGLENSAINLLEQDGVAASLIALCEAWPPIAPDTGCAISGVTLNGTIPETEYGVGESMSNVMMGYIKTTASSMTSPEIEKPEIEEPEIEEPEVEEPEIEESEIEEPEIGELEIEEPEIKETEKQEIEEKGIEVQGAKEKLGSGIHSENYKETVLTEWNEVDSALEEISTLDLTDEAVYADSDICLLKMNIQNSSGIVPDDIWNRINETPERAVHFFLGDGVALTACTDSLNTEYENMDLSKVTHHQTEGNLNYRKVTFHDKRAIDGKLQFHTYLPNAHRGQNVNVYHIDKDGNRTHLTTTTVGDNSSVCLEISELQDYEFEYENMNLGNGVGELWLI